MSRVEFTRFFKTKTLILLVFLLVFYSYFCLKSARISLVFSKKWARMKNWTHCKCGFIQSSHHTVAVTTNIPSQERRPSTGLIRVKTLLGQRQEWDRAAASRLKYCRGRLKSGTPPPDRRFSWIPSGTVSKVLTVWNLCTPDIQSGLGEGLWLAMVWRVWSLGDGMFSPGWCLCSLY